MGRVLAAAKRLAALAAGLAVLAAGLAALLAARPELLVNPRSAAWALGRFGKAFEPRWESLSVWPVSLGAFDKDLVVHARGLCWRTRRPETSGCLERLDLRVGARVGFSGLEELRLEYLDAYGGSIRGDLSRPAERAAPPTGEPARAPAWLGLLRVGSVAVELPSVRVALASGTLAGAWSLSLPPAPREGAARAGGKRRALSARGEGLWRDASGPKPFGAALALETDAFDGRLSFLTLSADADAGPLGQGRAWARVEPGEGGSFAVDAEAEASAGQRRVSAALRGRGRRREWGGVLSARYADRAGPVSAVGLDGCRGELGLDPELRLERASLACRCWLEPRPFGREAPARLAGFLTARGRVAGGRELDSRASLTIDPAGGWYRFSGRLSASAAGTLGSGARGLRIRHDAQAELRVPRFEDLVAYFRGSAFALPAPLNALHGPVHARVRGSGDSRLDPQRFAVDARTELHNAVQSVALRVRGGVTATKLWTPERRFAARLEAALDDVAIELPYLEVQAPPKVALDPRITSGGGPEPELRLAPAPRPRPLPVELSLRVHTPAKPVRLHTNLLRDPVPLRLDLELAAPAAASSGTIWTEPFLLELFGRKAEVERLSARQRPGSRSIELDAAIRYKTPEAVVRILLLGTTDKPRVQFMSEPPMDRSQVLALLLFGKPPSELDADQAASVGHTNAALTEQAFGLASLFLFASTPIEYVGYNPEAGTYTIRFRLPGGATAEVGSDLEESRRVRVRKRLSRRWAVETELRRELATERNAVATFLEWFLRY
ncbi:MAG: translocation/assembly module TamB domain-containing protein [Elusimicrobia bacterium]|nr:translocation/assembly module TamB domain-containing protein [Elusimicrobiota bacterium]